VTTTNEIFPKYLLTATQDLRASTRQGEKDFKSSIWSEVKKTLAKLEGQVAELERQAQQQNDPLARMARGESLSDELRETLLIPG